LRVPNTLAFFHLPTSPLPAHACSLPLRTLPAQPTKWCGHCKKLTPEYDAAATALKQEGSKARLAKVDATAAANAGLKARYEVQGFPKLKLFRWGEFEKDYSGERTAAAVEGFMRAAAAEPAKERPKEAQEGRLIPFEMARASALLKHKVRVVGRAAATALGTARLPCALVSRQSSTVVTCVTRSRGCGCAHAPLLPHPASLCAAYALLLPLQSLQVRTHARLRPRPGSQRPRPAAHTASTTARLTRARREQYC
jgi:thiol-disulfide isomerase/thioredoxin